MTQPRPSQGNHRLPVLALVLLVGVVAGVAGVSMTRALGGRLGEPPPGREPDALPPGVVELGEAAQTNAGVEVVEVVGAVVKTSIELTGVVAPDESRIVHIRPLARGVILSVDVSLGDRVAAGQALVTYDNIELGELVGEYLSAVAGVRQADTDVDVRQRYRTRRRAHQARGDRAADTRAP